MYICIAEVNGTTFYYGPFTLEEAYAYLAFKESQPGVIECRISGLILPDARANLKEAAA